MWGQAGKGKEARLGCTTRGDMEELADLGQCL